ncbi:MAG TPA: S26 family signal peptidase, partial [Gammaproteobacteria bacterium]|nr:S26 family signal peptidase [Gammaproteobacteria bacterium]
MQNLQKRFQKWHDKFQAKQDTFQKLVDKYQASGSTRYYNHYRTLLEQEKSLACELNATLQKGGEFDRRAVAYSIKRFKKIYKELHEASKGFIRQWIEAIVVAGFAVLILHNFIFGLYHVPTGSAEPTLLVGDRVWGNRLAYRLGAKPQRESTS